MEASQAVVRASTRGLLTRRSRLIRLQGDDRLVELIRGGHDRAFDALFDRYQPRLLAFCSQMLPCEEDAEDVLQEVFTKAHAAMLADQRPINVRPWLYRIARNRCLNHLRRRTADGQDSMDVLPYENGASVADRVQDREELRHVLADVHALPETQRTALLLRETEALSYEEIAEAMATTVPAVKSLLVRARIALAEASEARLLTCDEVRLALAEAAEGLRKASGPVRQHVRRCEECGGFRRHLRSDQKSLAGLAPLGLLPALKGLIFDKLGWLTGAGSQQAAGGAVAGAGGAGAGGAVGGGATAAGGTSALLGGGAGSLAGGVGGALGTKAAAGIATAALLTAGAYEVGKYRGHPAPAPLPAAAEEAREAKRPSDAVLAAPASDAKKAKDAARTEQAATTPPLETALAPPAPAETSAVAPEPVTEPTAGSPSTTDGTDQTTSGGTTTTEVPGSGGAVPPAAGSGDAELPVTGSAELPPPEGVTGETPMNSAPAADSAPEP